MYPERELNELAGRKAVLRRAITLHRAQCIAAAGSVVRPLEWLGRVADFGRRLMPLVQFATVPLGFFARRAASPRIKIVGALLRWGPLVVKAVQGWRAGATKLKA